MSSWFALNFYQSWQNCNCHLFLESDTTCVEIHPHPSTSQNLWFPLLGDLVHLWRRWEIKQFIWSNMTKTKETVFLLESCITLSHYPHVFLILFWRKSSTKMSTTVFLDVSSSIRQGTNTRTVYFFLSRLVSLWRPNT